jgi:hypothetical protein
MQLTDDQKQQVSQWIAQGATLADVQNRLDQDFQIRMTYMDVRFLMDDLKVTPQDPPEPEKPAEPQGAATPVANSTGAEIPAGEAGAPADLDEELPDAPLSGKVKVAVDTLTRPGSVVSGKVTFSDGETAEWYLDQFGRLGMVPGQQGYRPPEGDVQEFQQALERELMNRGF